MMGDIAVVQNDQKRAGFVALVGASNAGKSTLLNRLMGTKVSIVTHKVQTTRTIIRGITVEGNSQIIFIDTPGIFKPKRELDHMMMQAAWRGAANGDLVALVVDSKRRLDPYTAKILDTLSKTRQRAILVLNKIDLVEKDTLLGLTAELNERVPFSSSFMVSAQTGDGISSLKEFLAQAVPIGPWLYPEDQISDTPVRVLAAEITREKLFLRVHDEVPYDLTVETSSWKEIKGGKEVRIEQIIYVARDSQRKIVLGKDGAVIKSVSMSARADLESLLGIPVHLFLLVKVHPEWVNLAERLLRVGISDSD